MVRERMKIIDDGDTKCIYRCFQSRVIIRHILSYVNEINGLNGISHKYCNIISIESIIKNNWKSLLKYKVNDSGDNGILSLEYSKNGILNSIPFIHDKQLLFQIINGNGNQELKELMAYRIETSSGLVDKCAAMGNIEAIKYLTTIGNKRGTSLSMDTIFTLYNDKRIIFNNNNNSNSLEEEKEEQLNDKLKKMKELIIYFNQLGYECSTACMDTMALTKGSIEIIKYLNENRVEGCTDAAITNAASVGDLQVIKYLWENRKEGAGTESIKMAAKGGFMDCVEYLHKVVGAHYDQSVIKAAIPTKNKQLIKYLMDNHMYVDYDEGIVESAVETMDFEIIKLIVEYPVTPKLVVSQVSFEMVCSHDNPPLDIVEYMYTHSRYFGYKAIWGACTKGNLPLLKLLIEKYQIQMSGDKLLFKAILSSNIECVKYLKQEHSLKLEFAKIIEVVDANPTLEMARYLFEECELIKKEDYEKFKLIQSASSRGNLQLVKYFHENEIGIVGKESINAAASQGHLQIVKYLHEVAKIEITRETVDAAIHSDKIHVIKYVFGKTGTGCSTREIERSLGFDRHDIIQYIFSNTKPPFIKTPTLLMLSQMASFNMFKYLLKGIASETQSIGDELSKSYVLSNIVKAAVTQNQIELLTYLHTIVDKLPAFIVDHAAIALSNGSIASFKMILKSNDPLLIERAKEYISSKLYVTALFGTHELLEYLVDVFGLPVTTATVTSACHYGRYTSVKFALDRIDPSLITKEFISSCILKASNNNYLTVLKYLIERFKPTNLIRYSTLEEARYMAIQCNYYTITIYLESVLDEFKQLSSSSTIDDLIKWEYHDTYIKSPYSVKMLHHVIQSTCTNTAKMIQHETIRMAVERGYISSLMLIHKSQKYNHLFYDIENNIMYMMWQLIEASTHELATFRYVLKNIYYGKDENGQDVKNPEMPTHTNNSPLLFACRHKNMTVVDYILRNLVSGNPEHRKMLRQVSVNQSVNPMVIHHLVKYLKKHQH